MVYQLMNKDRVICEFNVLSDSLEFIGEYRLLDNNWSNKFKTKNKLEFWINNRVIQTNRNHIENIMESIGMTGRTKFDLLKVNHGCSLNDTLWIKEFVELNINNKSLKWEDVSLYRGFKESLGLISFFGNTTSLGGNLKTPETTSQGMLSKAWRIIDNRIILYKRGTYGASNWGREPYSEVIASKVLEILGVPHIEYSLNKWDNILCSTCDLYTNESIGYLSMAQYLSDNYTSNTSEWNFSYISDIMENLGYLEQFKEMLFIDSLILNFDRHFNNFGFKINNDTGEIIGYMPLFDHGYSLGNFLNLEDSIRDDYNRQGTFANISLLAQGRSLRGERFAKTIIKDINLGIDDLDYLNVPRDRIIIAKRIIKEMISKILE